MCSLFYLFVFGPALALRGLPFYREARQQLVRAHDPSLRPLLLARILLRPDESLHLAIIAIIALAHVQSFPVSFSFIGGRWSRLRTAAGQAN